MTARNIIHETSIKRKPQPATAYMFLAEQAKTAELATLSPSHRVRPLIFPLYYRPDFIVKNDHRRQTVTTVLYIIATIGWPTLGMQVLQYPRYCNNSGSLTPLPCRVVNQCLVVQVLVRTEG